MPGGRPQHGVWHYFIKHPGQGNTVCATCKGCFEEMSPLAGRLQHHAAKCQALVSAGFTGQLDVDVDDEEVTVVTPPAKKRKVRQEILQPVVTDKATKLLIDEQLTRFVVGANLPFRCVAHPEFAKLVHMLRPGYVHADCKYVVGPLLDDLNRKEFERAAGQLKGAFCTLQMDGWTSPSHDPTLVTSIQVNGSSFLWVVEDTNGQPHTHRNGLLNGWLTTSRLWRRTCR